jgi:hypothetical protein
LARAAGGAIRGLPERYQDRGDRPVGALCVRDPCRFADAKIAVDKGHLVALANRMVEVRQRVTRDLLGQRGTIADCGLFGSFATTSVEKASFQPKSESFAITSGERSTQLRVAESAAATHLGRTPFAAAGGRFTRMLMITIRPTRSAPPGL